MTTGTGAPLKLYELSEAYRVLEDILSADEAEKEEWQSALDGIGEQFEDKVRAIARLIKNYQASSEAYKAEADRLQKKAKSMTERANWLKDYIKEAFLQTGHDKVEGTPGVKLHTNPQPSVEVTVGVEALPERYRKHIEYDEPDKALMLHDWKSGGWINVPGVTITQGKHIRIV